MKIKKNNSESPNNTSTEELTLQELARTPSESAHISVLILLLTLNAGWTDLVAYLFLGKTFASFMTGNILFVGLALAQANTELLTHDVVALLINWKRLVAGLDDYNYLLGLAVDSGDPKTVVVSASQGAYQAV